ncbi:alginate lyase family protein [Candidatus Sumerlaeota bacterium]|nr:alginate lyase family protein [Candidatus Sumerlaeota bacterium]
MSLGAILKYWRTARHLRTVQIIGQLRNRLRPIWENPQRFAAEHTPPPYAGCHWRLRASFPSPLPRLLDAGQIQQGRLTFLNQTHDLGWPPDWQPQEASKLWLYNLHYFDWLWALDFPQAREAALDWIERYPLRAAVDGWEPYPVSLRLMNWCGCFLDRFRRETEADPDFLQSLWGSVSLQTEWLMRHLEYHLLGNHLLENAAALTIAGSCFAGDQAREWRARGLRILTDQIPEQILPDGMHFERSPMYHLRIAYLLLVLRNIDDDGVYTAVQEPLPRVLQAARMLAHPDGEIALFNDSAQNVYPAPSRLQDMAESILGASAISSAEDDLNGFWSLPDAGYYGWRGENGEYLIIDAGAIGPDYQPGHAHGDIFSYELSWRGTRLIVDSGVCTYEPGAMRQYLRSTQAHNTIEINGQDQCEFWGAFRTAHRGMPRDVECFPSATGFRLSGWHDGYERLPGAPRHRREFHWDAASGLQVKDRIVSKRPVRIVSRIHLHPDCRVMESGKNAFDIICPSGKAVIQFEGDGAAYINDGQYGLEFNKLFKMKTLAFHGEGRRMDSDYIVSLKKN